MEFLKYLAKDTGVLPSLCITNMKLSDIILILCSAMQLSILIVCIMINRRVDKVANYRLFLLEIIEEKAKDHRDLCRRLDVFRQVEFHDMVIKFWKRLDDFYPDKSFLQ